MGFTLPASYKGVMRRVTPLLLSLVAALHAEDPSIFQGSQKEPGHYELVVAQALPGTPHHAQNLGLVHPGRLVTTPTTAAPTPTPTPTPLPFKIESSRLGSSYPGNDPLELIRATTAKADTRKNPWSQEERRRVELARNVLEIRDRYHPLIRNALGEELSVHGFSAGAITPEMIEATIAQESSMNPEAVDRGRDGSIGAGLMQVTYNKETRKRFPDVFRDYFDAQGMEEDRQAYDQKLEEYEKLEKTIAAYEDSVAQGNPRKLKKETIASRAAELPQLRERLDDVKGEIVSTYEKPEYFIAMMREPAYNIRWGVKIFVEDASVIRNRMGSDLNAKERLQYFSAASNRGAYGMRTGGAGLKSPFESATSTHVKNVTFAYDYLNIYLSNEMILNARRSDGNEVSAAR